VQTYWRETDARTNLKLVTAVNLLEVNNELLLAIVDDQDTDSTGVAGERFVDLLGQAALVDDLEVGLEVARLVLGNEGTTVTSSQDEVLLEGGGEHGVLDDRGRWVGDNAGLLDHAAVEDVNTEVTMLAGGGRGGDADDLAWALLEDHQVTNAEVVAWDAVVESESSGSRSWGRSGSGNNVDLWLADLLGHSDVHIWKRVGLVGLGVERLGNLGLSGLDGVEDLINLAAEEFGVMVTAGGAVGRHFLGRG